MSVMKKQLMKVRQIADQAIFRSDKTEVLNKELERTEKQLDGLKQPCQVLYKKMRACHQGSQEPLDKRRKHMPEIQLSNCMSELLDTHLEGNTLLWQVLKTCSELQERLGETLLEAHIQAEKDVILTLHDFSEKEIHNVGKLRKQLFKLSQDMDSARVRYESSVKNMQPYGGGPSQMKVEGFKEEVEELSMKVEQAKDTYAAEIYALVSRESSICHSFVQWYEMQTAYHEKCLQLLNSSTPALQKLIDQSSHHPLFGYSLEDHLQRTGREIALVLEACVLCLLETAINEEGLFRVAGSASKVKKLKNALDAGVSNMYEYVTDPHAVAGALKSYLRALPEPLMTYSSYDDWIQADRIADADTRLQRLWQVLNGIPKENYNNLRYLIKFLHCLCKSSEYNKMSSQNMSIVIAPNLLWSPASQQSNHIGLNMCAANAHSSIVETLISYCDWFFPEEVVFRQTLGPLPSPKGLLTPPVTEDVSAGPLSVRGIINTAFEGANGESEDSCSFISSGNGQSPRVIHRPGKKPAPPVPQVLGNQSTDTDVDSYPRLRGSPPNLDRQISRSATLDRPGKPKRAPTRKSHDNLASLLSPDDSLQNHQSSQHPEQKVETEAILVAFRKESSKEQNISTMSLQSTVNKEPISQSSATNQNHMSAEDRRQDRANWFLGEIQPVFRKERGSQPSGTVALKTQQSLKKDESDKPQSENTVQEVVEHCQVVPKGRDSESANNQGTNVQKAISESVTANQSGACQDASARQPEVPFVAKRKDVAKQSSQENIYQSYATESVPVYENISSQLNKNVDSVQQPSETQQSNFKSQEQKGTHTSGAAVNSTEIEKPSHTTVSRSQEVSEKPQVPCKPAAFSGESRAAQENSATVERSGETNPVGEEQGAKSGSGDKRQSLTSGQRTERMPERPSKQVSVEATEGEKKPPLSPSTKVKPPRPQPPAPPVKPKPSNDAEDTRL